MTQIHTVTTLFAIVLTSQTTAQRVSGERPEIVYGGAAPITAIAADQKTNSVFASLGQDAGTAHDLLMVTRSGTKRMLRTVDAGNMFATGLALSPNGEYLAVGGEMLKDGDLSSQGHVTILRTMNASELLTIPHRFIVQEMKFTSLGGMLLTVSGMPDDRGQFKGELNIFEIRGSIAERRFSRSLDAMLYSADVSADATTIAVGGSRLVEGELTGFVTLIRLDLANGRLGQIREVTAVNEQNTQTTVVRFSRNDKYLFTGDSKGKVTMWATEALAKQRTFVAHEGGAEIMAMVNLGNKQDSLVTAGRDGSIVSTRISRESVARLFEGDVVLALEDGNDGIWAGTATGKLMLIKSQ